MRRIIGQAPGRDVPPGLPLAGRSGAFLARVAGLESAAVMRELATVENVLTFWPGKSGGKGDAFPPKTARAAAARFSFAPGERVLFVGKKAAESFEFRAPFLTWMPFRRGVAAVCPHPSGINLWWNDGENRRRAARFLRRFFRAG